MPNTTVLNEKEATAITEKHMALWNETDESRHPELISALYSPGIEMVDSFFVAQGHNRVRDAIAGFHASRPGSRFTTAKQIEYHHNVIRMYWHNGPAEKPDAGSGMDLFVVENGKVVKLYVFVDDTRQ